MLDKDRKICGVCKEKIATVHLLEHHESWDMDICYYCSVCGYELTNGGYKYEYSKDGFKRTKEVLYCVSYIDIKETIAGLRSFYKISSKYLKLVTGLLIELNSYTNSGEMPRIEYRTFMQNFREISEPYFKVSFDLFAENNIKFYKGFKSELRQKKLKF